MAEQVILNGVVHGGVVVPEGQVRLPDGVPVKLVVTAADLPADVRARLTGPAADDTADAGAEEWERVE
jgi:hypothetical protein